MKAKKTKKTNRNWKGKGLLLFILIPALLFGCADRETVISGQDFEWDVTVAYLSKLHSCGYIEVDSRAVLEEPEYALFYGFLTTNFPERFGPAGDNSSETEISGGFMWSVIGLMINPETDCQSFTLKDHRACIQALALTPCESTYAQQIKFLNSIETQNCRPRGALEDAPDTALREWSNSNVCYRQENEIQRGFFDSPNFDEE